MKEQADIDFNARTKQDMQYNNNIYVETKMLVKHRGTLKICAKEEEKCKKKKKANTN